MCDAAKRKPPYEIKNETLPADADKSRQLR